MGLFGFGDRPEQRFWRWFREHEGELFSFEQDQERVFDALSRALARVHPHLTFEFGPHAHGRRDFVVSADGLRDAFPAVDALVGAAPPLPRWRVVRFRPRRDPAVTLRIGDVAVDGTKVFVAVAREGPKFALTLFVDGYRPTSGHVYEQIALLLLDVTLGEYDVETRIGTIEVAGAASAPATGLLPLSALPALVDGARAL